MPLGLVVGPYGVLALVLVCLTPLLLPAYLCVAVACVASWYSLMSFADWGLHRYVLHDDRSPMPHWRRGHRTHHMEFDSGIGRSGISLTFPHGDVALIALATLPLGLLAGSWVVPLRPVPLMGLLAAHTVGIAFFVGVHNYAHSCFHGYKPPPWRSHACVPVPGWLCGLLHEHHRQHHEDAGVNYCTVLLGFDWIAGTQPCQLPSVHCWPARWWSHVPSATPDAGGAKPEALRESERAVMASLFPGYARIDRYTVL